MAITKAPDELAAWFHPRNVGARLVAHWLAASGYATNIETKAPGCADMEARGNTRSMLVRVNLAKQPNEPNTMPPDEERNMTARAARLGFEAWEACVTLDDQLRQVGEIQWRKLS